MPVCWRAPMAALTSLVVVVTATACRTEPPARQYQLTGQVLAVTPARQEITIKHDDIPGFMPAMTMTYRLATAELMEDREPGELLTATLEVTDTEGRLTAITRTGTAPLPAGHEAALAGGVLEPGDLVPDAAFIDQSDRRRSFDEWRGSLTLVTFIYTNCPVANFCPLMDQNFATIQGAVAEDPQLKGQVRLVSITFDPARDTPAVLAAHAARRRADPAVWTFLTADEVTTNRFAARFGVGVIPSTGTADITHSLRTALVDRNGRIVKFYSGNEWTPGAVLADLRQAAGRS
jgi:protein SCO1/2